MADALIDAVRENDVALVKQLIGRGADVKRVARDGLTALWWAARQGCVECTKVLLEANADVDKADHIGWTPLHVSSRNGLSECVKLLIDWKADVNAKTLSGDSSLHLAASGGNVTCIQLLIDWKADVNARTDLDDSPLHLAAREGDLACIEILIQAGAEVDARHDGMTSLALAFLNNEPDVAELLLDKGAKMSNVNVPIPDWMNAIVTKRQNMRRSLTTFIGVLRKRFAVSGGGTEYTRGRLPRDVVGVISKLAWSTRFDKRWEAAVPETVNKL